MRQDYLLLKSLVKVFGTGEYAVTAVDNVNVEVKEGELVTLLGPSGCGKTTTLRMIAGFELPTSGEILIDGEDVSTTPPNRRPTTMVFQNYALFPHLTVFENIAYGLKIRREPAQNIRKRTREIMRLVGLEGMGERSPAQLSGGQQQRVSLARSLIMEPKVLLLDEPLSNLDAKLRVSTRLEIRKLQQRVGITSVYVTHDQEEAMTLSDRVVIMHQGKIMQIGTPQEIYARPGNRFVADFIGKANFLEGRVGTITSKNEIELDVMGKKFQVPPQKGSFSEGQRVVIIVRPESVELEPKKPNTLIGTVRETVYLGSEMVYEIEMAKSAVTVQISNPQEHVVFEEGDEVSITFQERSLHILPYEEAQ
ncbi:MAG: ABC transporter ATP-binding protein [Thermodesulfobacteriota bacterium]